jgi:hypothetical protein
MMAQKETTEIPEAVRKAAEEAARRVIEAGATSLPADGEERSVREVLKEINMVEFGSEAHERLLTRASGGKMNKAKAELIIKEREEKPELWPYDVYEQATDFLAALTTTPKPTAPNPAWRLMEVA